MSSRFSHLAVAAAFALVALSCGKSEKAKPISATIDIEAGAVIPAATVTLELPGGWHPHEVFKDTWLPGTDAFAVSVKATTSCGGECSAEKMADNITAMIEQDVKEYWTQGDAPHLTPTVEIIEKGELPLGRYRAFRLSYPKAPKGKAQGRSGLHLECFITNPGDRFYVEIEADAVPKKESQIWPGMLDSCKGATYTVAK
jgi:hypothetical protein